MKKIGDLVNLIKQVSTAAVEADNPVNLMFGEVIQTNPLSVTVDQRFTLDEDFLIVPESLTFCKITVGDTDYMIRPGLVVGDGVLMLRMQGGQQFVILDKVVQT